MQIVAVLAQLLPILIKGFEDLSNDSKLSKAQREKHIETTNKLREIEVAIANLPLPPDDAGGGGRVH